MEKKNLTMTRVSYKNIIKKPIRSVLLVFIIALLIMTIFMGSITSSFLSKGTAILSDRLGADLIIVPEGHSTDLETILLRGQANSFFLPNGSMHTIKNIEGIEKVSPQTYLTTLRSGCCSIPIQLMGIDFENDFLIKSWLMSSVKNELQDDQIIVGNKIKGSVGDELTFFGIKLKIAGKLDPSGLGFDATGFLNMNTVQKLAARSKRAQDSGLFGDSELISSIMVKLTPGYDAREVSRTINNQYASYGIYSIIGKRFVNDVSKNLYGIAKYIDVLIGIICVMSLILLGVVFSIIINERKREVNLFRVLGATKKQLVRLLLLESFLISMIGTVVGLILGSFGVALFLPLLAEHINLPIIFPGVASLVPVAFLFFVIGISIGPLFSFFSTLKIMNNEIYSEFREQR